MTPNDSSITVQLPNEIKEAIAQEANARGMKTATYVRVLLMEHVAKQHEEHREAV